MGGKYYGKQKLFGLRHTPFHNTWKNLFPKCLNPNNPDYKDYGGRGIEVCDEWYEFSNFIVDMYELYEYHIEHFGSGQKNCQLDRMDNNKGYYRDNCRWATSKVNNNNRRDYPRLSHLTFITYKGQTKYKKEWADYLGMKYDTLKCRFRKGWSIEKALTTPVRKAKNISL